MLTITLNENTNFMDALRNGSFDLSGPSDTGTVFNGKDYSTYSLAILITQKRLLENVIRTETRGIPGVAEYGVSPATYDELRAVKRALVQKEYYF